MVRADPGTRKGLRYAVMKQLIFSLPFFLFPLIAFAVGGVLLYFRHGTVKKTGLMRRVQTTDAARVSGLAPGELAEVKGTLRCDFPLQSEMAARSCAYYRARVLEVYREHSEHGHGSRRREKTLSDDEQSVEFYVEDATGRILVPPEGAEVDGEKVVDRFEEADGGFFSSKLGDRYVEEILAVDAPVYVLGVVGAGGHIGVPPAEDRAHRFVISHRAEEDLEQTWRHRSLLLGIGAGCAFAFGGFFVLVALLFFVVLLAAG